MVKGYYCSETSLQGAVVARRSRFKELSLQGTTSVLNSASIVPFNNQNSIQIEWLFVLYQLERFVSHRVLIG